jgi:hypothetical protein
MAGKTGVYCIQSPVRARFCGNLFRNGCVTIHTQRCLGGLKRLMATRALLFEIGVGSHAL